MRSRDSQASRPPGERLSRIARTLYPNDPIVTSLDALIADAQREWLLREGQAARCVRRDMVVSFWRSVMAHGGRLLLTSDRHVLRLSAELIAFGFGATLGIGMLVRGDSTSIARLITEGFMMFSGVAASVFHPANVAQRMPSATPRGWWPFAQFLLAWLTAFAIWLYAIDGSYLLFIIAVVVNAPIGVLFSRWFSRWLPLKPRA